MVSLALIGACVYVAYKAIDYRRHVNYFLDKYTHVVSSFSGRRQYSDANSALAAAQPQKSRLVFLGDQIIESWPLEVYFPDYETLNRGITGQWLAGFLLRLRPDVLELKPEAVVIQFSSYNFRPQFTVQEIKDYVVSLAELCRYNNVEPLLTTVIPVRGNENVFRAEGFQPYFVADSTAQFNRWLSDYCRLNSLLLIDYNSALADDDGYLPVALSIDNTHLTETGFKRLADITSAALAELPNLKRGKSE
jgi:lysophospholipase L1-like esterase